MMCTRRGREYEDYLERCEKTMTLESYYAPEIERCTTKIAEELAKGVCLHTDDLYKYMAGEVRFSKEFIKAVHAMINRKLLAIGLMLVCYPHIIPPYDPMDIRINGYMYQAVPIEEAKR